MYKNYMSLKRDPGSNYSDMNSIFLIIEDLDRSGAHETAWHPYNNELQAISMLPMSYTDY